MSLIFDKRSVASLVKAFNPGLLRDKSRVEYMVVRPDGHVQAINDGCTMMVSVKLGYVSDGEAVLYHVASDIYRGVIEPGPYKTNDLRLWSDPHSDFVPGVLDEGEVTHPTFEGFTSRVEPVLSDPQSWDIHAGVPEFGIDVNMLKPLAAVKWVFPDDATPAHVFSKQPKATSRFKLAHINTTNPLNPFYVWNGEMLRALVMPVRSL